MFRLRIVAFSLAQNAAQFVATAIRFMSSFTALVAAIAPILRFSALNCNVTETQTFVTPERPLFAIIQADPAIDLSYSNLS